jgi:hypothetical protein
MKLIKNSMIDSKASISALYMAKKSFLKKINENKLN